MKNKLWLLVGIVISLILISNLASAFCVTAFYTKDEQGNFIKADLITGVCKNNGQVKLIKYQAGGLYSWGNVFDSCEKVCGVVKINATVVDNGKIIMFGEKELSSKNVNDWNNESTKFFNLTLIYVDDDAKKSGSGSSHIVQPNKNNPTGVQITGNTPGSNIIGDKKDSTDTSKHLNNPNDSTEQSIIKDWMIYGIIGFVLVLGILAFLFVKNKRMGGKI